jgi:hypothetical protein
VLCPQIESRIPMPLGLDTCTATDFWKPALPGTCQKARDRADGVCSRCTLFEPTDPDWQKKLETQIHLHRVHSPVVIWLGTGPVSSKPLSTFPRQKR